MGPGRAAARAAAVGQLEFLTAALKINATDVLAMSYADMMGLTGTSKQSAAIGSFTNK